METTSTLYVHSRMYRNGLDEHFDTKLPGHINMDGVINATNEHRRSNRKKCGNARTSNLEVKFCQSCTRKGARSSLLLRIFWL